MKADGAGNGNRSRPAPLAGMLAACVMLLLAPALAAGQASAWPVAPPVGAQPLLAHVRRVRQALIQSGVPLPLVSARLLRQAEHETDDRRTTALVQRALDPLCAAGIRLTTGRPLSISDNPTKPRLVEQGWQPVLVKVVNDAESTAQLQIASRNARPLAGSPRSEVPSRWLDIEPSTQQPLSPDLSGLRLEYRVLQLYSRGAGRRIARLAFSIGVTPVPNRTHPTRRTVRQWNFRSGVEGWVERNDCEAQAKDGVLRIRSTGRDPYLVCPVQLPGGPMRLRIRLKTDHDDVAQVFWGTDRQPEFDGGRQTAYPISRYGGGWHEYTTLFTVDGDLRRLRIDLGGRPGRLEIDWLELSSVDAADAGWVEAPLEFRAAASRKVVLHVRDEHDRPCTASFVIRDVEGRVYPAQSKRLAPDFHFQSQIYRADGETVRLPAGRYTIDCRRGPESLPESKTLIVGKADAALTYRVRRWIDPAARGWWSGDHHIHAAGCLHYSSPTQGVSPKDMERHILGEDLKVGASLTWGPCFDFQKRFFTGLEDKASAYPYLLRYDIEVSGFGSHQSGHLCLLGLRSQIYPGGASTDHWPTLGLSTLRWARAQGAVCGPAHSAIGLTSLTADRIAGPDGPGGLPSYQIPAFDGIGANEYIVDVTHTVPDEAGRPVPAVDFISAMDTERQAELNIWYHTLNCGYRTRLSGETDFPCLSGERVGGGRVYVKQAGRLTYDKWRQGIREGRSYVSDGSNHLMEFTATGASGQSVAVGSSGSELRLSSPGRLTLRVLAAARTEGGKSCTVEAIVNGYPVAASALAGDGREQALTFTVEVRQSSWVAIRAFPGAHTNPIFVLVGGKPIRAGRRSAQWCLRGVDQCWSQKERFYAPAEKETARAAYEHARKAYLKIESECDGD